MKYLSRLTIAVALLSCLLWEQFAFADKGATKSIAPAIKTQAASPKASNYTLHTILSATNIGNVGWQVVGAGATRSISGTTVIEGTAGQSAIGDVSFPNYRLSQGFWQVFETPCKRGDANSSGDVNISDAVFLINFIFNGGKAPLQECLGDSDGNGTINISDVVHLLQYIFR